MRVLLLFLMISCGTPFVKSQESLPPLTPEERRTVLFQLYELRSCRVHAETLTAYIERDIEQDASEKSSYERALELEQQATRLTEKERDLALEKAGLYEQLYRGVTKRPGVGCRVLRAITMGVHRCR
jgi:hypothetical protein